MDTSSFVTREELVALYELQLLSTANHFTLWGEANARHLIGQLPSEQHFAEPRREAKAASRR